MKLRSNVCNRCRLVCVKFYLNRSRFVVLQNVKGLTFLGHTVFFLLLNTLWYRQWSWSAAFVCSSDITTFRQRYL